MGFCEQPPAIIQMAVGSNAASSEAGGETGTDLPGCDCLHTWPWLGASTVQLPSVCWCVCLLGGEGRWVLLMGVVMYRMQCGCMAGGLGGGERGKSGWRWRSLHAPVHTHNPGSDTQPSLTHTPATDTDTHYPTGREDEPPVIHLPVCHTSHTDEHEHSYLLFFFFYLSFLHRTAHVQLHPSLSPFNQSWAKRSTQSKQTK